LGKEEGDGTKIKRVQKPLAPGICRWSKSLSSKCP